MPQDYIDIDVEFLRLSSQSFLLAPFGRFDCSEPVVHVYCGVLQEDVDFIFQLNSEGKSRPQLESVCLYEVNPYDVITVDLHDELGGVFLIFVLEKVDGVWLHPVRQVAALQETIFILPIVSLLTEVYVRFVGSHNEEVSVPHQVSRQNEIDAAHSHRKYRGSRGCYCVRHS